ncbi:MAG: DEAD/DEAH box helicase [Gammaproteobacteria bacterium]|nr:DEAD/DEAH box helicase [Gammaproteobacteria bacterium]
MRIVINSQIIIHSPTPDLIVKLKKDLILDNPKHVDTVVAGRSTWNIPKYLIFLQIDYSKDICVVPKGYYYTLLNHIKDFDVPTIFELPKDHFININFELPKTNSNNINFSGRLKQDQLIAGKQILQKNFGVLKAPTGGGKTVIALWTIARRKVTTLIIVHTVELMYQWRDRIKQFLNIPETEIGLVGNGVCNIKKITVGIVNSCKKLDFKQITFGQVIVDECHRVPASTFLTVLSKINSKYLLGLTATDRRSDKLDALIFLYCGEKICEIKTKHLEEKGIIIKPELQIIETGFQYKISNIKQRHAMVTAMLNNSARNALIVQKVTDQIKQYPAGIALVVSDRVEHCKKLKFLLSKNNRTEMLIGTVPNHERKETIEKLREGESNVLIATGQLIGEGFDLPTLSSVFLTTPISFDGKLQQIIGRIVRTAEGKKKAMIYDFSDQNWLLQYNLKKRISYYKKAGILKN